MKQALKPLGAQQVRETELKLGTGHPARVSAAAPAELWTDAWPIGNGRLGGMVFGGNPVDRIALNEESLYAGYPLPQGQPDIRGRLQSVRDLLREGRYAEADREVSQHMLGRQQECYQPLGDLLLSFPDNGGEMSGYRRTLCMETGVAEVAFTDAEGCQHERHYYASTTQPIIVVKLRTAEPGRLALRVRLKSPHPCTISTNNGALDMDGHVPAFCCRRTWEWIEGRGDQHKYPEVYDSEGCLRPGAQTVYYGSREGRPEGLRFSAGIKVLLTQGGLVTEEDGFLAITGATEVVLLLAAASSYSSFDQPANMDPKAEVQRVLTEAGRSTEAELRASHVERHRELFGRVRFSLSPEQPASDWVSEWRGVPSCEQALVEKQFQFGRYLLIAASPPNSRHPANLQGIWNELVTPPWAAAYTTNINLEMNYWLAGPAALPECAEPLFRLLEDCARNGRITAEKSYGLPGWVLHHNTDVWRKTDPVDNIARTAYWPLGSGWLCCHLWEHFLYEQDEEFLKQRAYPLMRGACEFYLGWLVENAEKWLVTPISTSPENDFVLPNGQTGSVCEGPTMDLSILRELFAATGSAARICGDEAFRLRVEEAAKRLLPFRVGKLGQLQEWAEDWDRADDHHRHYAHMFGVFPGSQIHSATPDLQRAALRSLELRGDGGAGWSQAWKASLYARLGEPEKARECLVALLLPAEREHGCGLDLVSATGLSSGTGWDSNVNVGGVYRNLLASCPPFQIDANFGFVTAVCEMLLQSHGGVIRLLPGLPAAWPEGRIEGLHARGALEVSIDWSGGRMTWAKVRSRHKGTREFLYQGLKCVQTLIPGVEHTIVAEDFA